jgi:bifunctional pyridoxal-dependent enzyme with beta-cystathionase and maltose regulon repressor activities
MILAILSGAVVNIITYAILMILSPIFMRMGGNQYLIRMQKYTKVVRKAMKSQVNTVMAGTGVIIEPGEYCMWLDFYRGSYPDEVPQNAIYFAQPVFYPMPPMPPMPPAQPLV